jgi:hypothetical protein
VVAVAYSLVLGSTIRFRPDETDYLALAHNLTKHGTYSFEGMQPTAGRAPGYPVALAALRLFSLPLAALRLLNFAAWGVVVWAGWRLARRIGGPAAATVAAPLLALYPLGIYTASAFYPQAFGAGLMMLALVLVSESVGSARALVLAGSAGFLFGALIVTLPTFIYVLVLAAVWLLLKRARRAAVVLIAAAAILPVAWMIRNAATMHAFVPIASNGGYNLLVSYSPDAGVRKGANVDIGRYKAHADARHLNEVETDRYYAHSALHWIEAHPGKASELYAGKNLDYFAPFDDLWTTEQSSVAKNVVAALTYLPFLALLALRLALWRRVPPSSLEKLLIAVYLVGAPVAAVFFTRVRFRLPADPLLLVVAAVFVAAWLTAGTLRRPAGN